MSMLRALSSQVLNIEEWRLHNVSGQLLLNLPRCKKKLFCKLNLNFILAQAYLCTSNVTCGKEILINSIFSDVKNFYFALLNFFKLGSD